MLRKKSIIIVLVIFSALSFLELYNLAPKSSDFYHTSSPSLRKIPPPSAKINGHASPPAEDVLSPKELLLLSDLISRKAPCNLLFFGIKPQFLALAAVNSGGATVFLEDDSEELKARVPGGMEIYSVNDHEKAGAAFELLEHARKDPSCRKRAGLLPGSKCRLVLEGLPDAVCGRKWDVIVVDGPIGDRPEAPGRMGTIYTAAVLAHGGRSADVFVHDTDRMIEKWYSWEFLCHENLVSSKGKLWHFRIVANSSSDEFCSQAAVQIL